MNSEVSFLNELELKFMEQENFRLPVHYDCCSLFFTFNLFTLNCADAKHNGKWCTGAHMQKYDKRRRDIVQMQKRLESLRKIVQRQKNERGKLCSPKNNGKVNDNDTDAKTCPR